MQGLLGYDDLGGTLENFQISLMVPIEVPIHKYFSGPQHYNSAIEAHSTPAKSPTELRMQRFRASSPDRLAMAEVEAGRECHVFVGFSVSCGTVDDINLMRNISDSHSLGSVRSC